MMGRLLEALRPSAGWSWSATRAAHLGRRRRRAPRPGRGLRGRPGLTGLRADPELPQRGGHQGARRCAPGAATPTPCSTYCGRRSEQVEFVEAVGEAEIEAALRPDAVEAGLAVLAAARDEDPPARSLALDRYRLLCAHREGPYGVRRWNQLVERWLAEEPGVDVSDQWYVGRPLLVTSNDYALDVYNGETGVVVRQGQRRRAFVAGLRRLKDFAPGRLDAVETMHAMTIHKSQGSQAETGHRAAARGGVAAADPRAPLHRGDPGRSAGSGWSAPRPPCAPPSSPRRSGRPACGGVWARPP